VAGAVSIIASVGVNYLADRGIISQNLAKSINIGLTVVGMASGIGGIIKSVGKMAVAGANVGKALSGAVDFCSGAGFLAADGGIYMSYLNTYYGAGAANRNALPML